MAGIGSLPLFHRVHGERIVVVGEGDMADAKRRLVERAGGIPCPETEAHHAKLAFVALEDEREATAAAIRLKRLGLLVNVADMPALCDFTTPSILDREPVLVAISTSGASAGLAKHIRLRLEQILPQSLASLAQALRDSREAIRARWPSPDRRRRAIDTALSEGGILDPMRGCGPDAVPRWLEGKSEEGRHGRYEIVLRSDDPDDLTLREARLLGEADMVLHEQGVPEAVLARARADAARRSMPYEGDETGVVAVLYAPANAER